MPILVPTAKVPDTKPNKYAGDTDFNFASKRSRYRVSDHTAPEPSTHTNTINTFAFTQLKNVPDEAVASFVP